MDNLKKYIKQHRDEFDSEEPRKKVWDKIENSISKKEVSTISIGGWLWRAAAVFLLLTTSVLLIDRAQQPEAIIVADEGDGSFMEEFDNAERFYLNQIDEMQSKLSDYAQDELISQQFMVDLNNLDSLYNTLKSDFRDSGSNERIADALIQNLRIRMEIINQQLMILERIKQQRNDENIQI